MAEREATEEAEMDQNMLHGGVHEQSEINDAFSKLPPLFSLVIQRYEGDICEGQPNGEGVACFEGGHVYKGKFCKGLMDGHGVFTWAGGLKYEGNFVRNTVMGQGMYTWPNGSTYKGEVYYGIQHGSGAYYCAKSGVLYEGQWHQGKRQGKGEVYYNQDKTNWYKGDWVKNNMEGVGVRRYLSGNIYTGEWKNNLRHGEGTIKWLQSGQQYEGAWHNGVQHGRGTHTWILKRENGSWYSQSNKYVGDFVHGQRHGHGTFYYPSGAVYKGEWRNNKKHGQGMFTFKNGKVFQGEFVDDQMMQLRSDRPPTPLGMFHQSDQSSVLGPDMTLNIDLLLKNIPEKRRDAEHKEVELVVLRHSSELRSIYSFYSQLGHSPSPDNTFMLSRLQLWRLLKDCNIHHQHVTLTQIDLLTKEDATPDEVHSPFTGMLFRRLLSCLVVIAYHIYNKDMASERDLLSSCFSKLMTNNILPNAKNVKGFLFRQQERTKVAMRYLRKSWEVYQTYCTPSAAPRDDKTMTCRDLLLMFKDFHLFDNKLTTTKFIEIITTKSPDPSNPSAHLLLEIAFLEFFETLLGCAEVKCELDCEDTGEVHFTAERSESDAAQTSEQTLETKTTSPVITTPVNSIIFQVSCSESELEASRDTSELSSAHHINIMAENLPEPTDENQGEGRECLKPKQKEPEKQLELWTQKINHFFNQVFFVAFEEHQTVKKLIKENNHSLKAQSHAALASSIQKVV